MLLSGLLEVRRALLSGATDAGRLATLSWDQFLSYISQLNEKCRELPDKSGKYVIFAIKKGTHDNVFWKATVRICAVKMNGLTGKIESRKIMTLPEFLRLHTTLDSLIVPQKADEAGASSSHFSSPMDASLIMQKIPSGEASSSSSPVGGSEERCCICMERRPEALLPCTHAFCLPCIEKWNLGRKWCPICRAELDSTADAWILEDGADAGELNDYLLNATKDTDPRHQPPPNVPR